MHQNPVFPLKLQPKYQRGFSMVEVSLAIAVIAIAFVSLFGLIPLGLDNYRQSADRTAEAVIMQQVNSSMQVTDFSKIPEVAFGKSDVQTTDGQAWNSTQGYIWFYDQDGRPVDYFKPNETSNDSTPDVIARRLYAVKLFFGDIAMVGESVENRDMIYKHAVRMIAVFSPVQSQNPRAWQEFEGLTNAAHVSQIKSSSIKVRSMLLARTETEDI